MPGSAASCAAESTSVTGPQTGLLGETEAWFVKRGLPHAIHEYSATEDVLTRAAPFLSFVFILEVFASFDDRFSGWAQLGVFLAGLAMMLAGVTAVNWLRGRRALDRPDEVGILEMTLFVFVPALLPLFFSDEPGWRFLGVAGANVVLLTVAYFVASFGLLHMLRFGAVQMGRRMEGIGQLLARTLPLSLLLTAFIFLNAEMWQVASDFAPEFYAIVVSFLVLAGLVFMALRAPREVADLETFESWDQVMERVERTDAPIAGMSPHDPEGRVAEPPHDRRHRLNVALLVIIAQFVQVLLVALVIGIFYVGFGLLAVRRSTIAQWTTTPSDPLSTFDLFGSEIILTWEHLAVAGFVAAFSALQFAVSMVTVAAFRDEFYEDVTSEVRDILAVRVLYYDAVRRQGNEG